MRNIKLTIFKDLYRQTKHNASNLAHTLNCQFYTEKLAQAFFSKEPHQIFNALSSRHPLKILHTIYPIVDFPSLFIKYFKNKEEKLSGNIALEPTTSTSSLVIWTTTVNYSSSQMWRSPLLKNSFLLLLLSLFTKQNKRSNIMHC